MRNRYGSRFCSLRFYTILRLVRDTISVCQRIMLCQKAVVKGFEPSHIRRRTFDISHAVSNLIAKPADMFELSVIIIPTCDLAPYSRRRCFHLLYVGSDSFFSTQHITAYEINVFILLQKFYLNNVHFLIMLLLYIHFVIRPRLSLAEADRYITSSLKNQFISQILFG